MTRIKKQIASGVVAESLKKHFERNAIMNIFPRMYLETEIDSRFVKGIQDRSPPSRQFIESCSDKFGGTLGPWVDIGPCERSRKCGMGRKPQIDRCLGGETQLFDCPRLPRSRVAPQCFRCKSVEQKVVGRMHGN